MRHEIQLQALLINNFPNQELNCEDWRVTHLTIAHLKLFWSTLYELFKTISADANLVILCGVGGWYCDEHLLWFWNVYKEGLFNVCVVLILNWAHCHAMFINILSYKRTSLATIFHRSWTSMIYASLTLYVSKASWKCVMKEACVEKVLACKCLLMYFISSGFMLQVILNY